MLRNVKMIVLAYKKYLETPKGQYEWFWYLVCLALIVTITALGWFLISYFKGA